MASNCLADSPTKAERTHFIRCNYLLMLNCFNVVFGCLSESKLHEKLCTDCLASAKLVIALALRRYYFIVWVFFGDSIVNAVYIDDFLYTIIIIIIIHCSFQNKWSIVVPTQSQCYCSSSQYI